MPADIPTRALIRAGRLGLRGMGRVEVKVMG
jgi:hypothetical protein